ncbi:MAG: hypothetical protein IPO66_23100 [Rhodanobacteraceae bacterium]|nr:hypothetical protein [Rhodanobacteraceae bacterium]
MSYTLEFVVPKVPNRKGQAWDFLEDLQDRFEDDRGAPHPLLKQLHAALVDRYPCLSSYADGDPAKEECPWADGPLINNFASEIGEVSIKSSRAAEIVPLPSSRRWRWASPSWTGRTSRSIARSKQSGLRRFAGALDAVQESRRIAAPARVASTMATALIAPAAAAFGDRASTCGSDLVSPALTARSCVARPE